MFISFGGLLCCLGGGKAFIIIFSSSNSLISVTYRPSKEHIVELFPRARGAHREKGLAGLPSWTRFPRSLRRPGGPDLPKAESVSDRRGCLGTRVGAGRRVWECGGRVFVPARVRAGVLETTLACGVGDYTCSWTRFPGVWGSQRLASQEPADPSLPGDLFKYSVRNNSI